MIENCHCFSGMAKRTFIIDNGDADANVGYGDKEKDKENGHRRILHALRTEQSVCDSTVW